VLIEPVVSVSQLTLAPAVLDAAELADEPRSELALESVLETELNAELASEVALDSALEPALTLAETSALALTSPLALVDTCASAAVPNVNAATRATTEIVFMMVFLSGISAPRQ